MALWNHHDQNKKQNLSQQIQSLNPKKSKKLILTLAKDVAYNIVKETITHGLIKALSNMYEKPSPSNKVYLIRLLFATRLKEGDCVTDHVNEFNSILSRLSSVDIKFDDEVQAYC